MKGRIFTICLTVLGVAFLMTTAGSLPVFAQDGKIRAKLGIKIKSGTRESRAKSRDRLKSGDLVRIYVHPEKSSFVYVVHSDQKTATLLNMVRQRVQSSTLVMPSLQEFYQVDGASSVENFTIICSQAELDEMSPFFETGSIPHEDWQSLAEDLQERGKIDLSQKTEQPFAIAGNVRGAGPTTQSDPFIRKLQIFSGKSILVKRYAFSVKK